MKADDVAVINKLLDDVDTFEHGHGCLCAFCESKAEWRAAGSPRIPNLPSAEVLKHAAMVLERAAADSLVFADINTDREYPWHELSTVAALLRALKGEP